MVTPSWLQRPARSGRALAGAFCAAIALEAAVAVGAAALLGSAPAPATREAPMKVSMVELPPTPPSPAPEPPPPVPPPPEPPPPVPEQAPEPPPPDQSPPDDPAPLPPPPEPTPPAPQPPKPRPRPKTPPKPIEKARVQPPDEPHPVALSAPTSASLNEMALFQGRVRQAVQRAVIYPMAARALALQGRAEVSFSLRGGRVGDVALAQSSGSPVLDRAALAAVRSAAYPTPPAAAQGDAIRFLIWVQFRPAED